MFLWWCHVSLLFHVSDGFALMSVHLRVHSLFGLASVGKDFHLNVVARVLAWWDTVSFILGRHSSIVSMQLCRLRSS